MLRRMANGGWLIAGFLLIVSAGIGNAEEGRPSSIPEAAVVPLQILEPTCDGTTCSLQATSRGSAVCIDRREGKVLLLTARHCLPEKPAEVMQVYLRGCWVRARCWKYSKLQADVSIIIADGADCDQLTCLGQRRPAIGEPVTLTGYTHGRTFQAITGAVIAVPPRERSDPLYDWAILPQQRFGRDVFGGSVVEGQSGGGVFDGSGDLVGILTNRADEAPWLGRYVAVDELRRMLASSGLLTAVTPRRDDPEPVPSGPRLAPAFPQPSTINPQPAPPDDKAGVEPAAVPLPKLDPLTPALPMVPREVKPLDLAPPDLVTVPKPSAGSPFSERPPGNAKTLINLPGILSELPGKMRETQGKPPVTMPVSAQNSSGFWASLIPLGISVAGTVLTGGAGWMMMVKPSLNTIHAGISEIKQHRQGSAAPASPAAVRGSWYGYGNVNDPPPPPPPAPPPPPPNPSAVNVSLVHPAESQPGGSSPAGVPFPRKLDEASQLLQLAKSEGRIPVLDALRGVFIDDELEKLATGPDSVAAALAVRLRQALETRINEVVPPSTQV